MVFHPVASLIIEVTSYRYIILEPAISIFEQLFQLDDEPNHYMNNTCFTKTSTKTGCCLEFELRIASTNPTGHLEESSEVRSFAKKEVDSRKAWEEAMGPSVGEVMVPQVP